MEQDKELAAMSVITGALEQFEEGEEAAVARIIQWAAARYGVTNIVSLAAVSAGSGTGNGRPGDGGEFEDLVDLFHAASPRTDPERALVGGYWITVGESQVEFTAQLVNSKLKDLGHGVGNITDAFSSLIKRRPSLVMQTAKTGTSRQARKRYKLTRAGLDQVSRMLQGEPEANS